MGKINKGNWNGDERNGLGILNYPNGEMYEEVCKDNNLNDDSFHRYSNYSWSDGKKDEGQ